MLDIPEANAIPLANVQVRLDADQSVYLNAVTDEDGWVDLTADGNPGPHYLRIYQDASQVIISSSVAGPSGPFAVNEQQEVLKTLGDGVVRKVDGELAVTAGVGFVTTAAGGCLGLGIYYKQYAARVDAIPSVATPGQSRIDTIAVQIQSNGTSKRVRVAGTPSASPTAPVLSETDLVVEVPLADVTTSYGSNQVNITDRREFMGLGVVVGHKLVNGRADANAVATVSSGGEVLAGLSFTLSLAAGVDYDVLARLDASTNPSEDSWELVNTIGSLSSPRGIAYNASYDQLWVCDYGNGRILRYSPSGSYLSQIGLFGTGNGQFKNPTGIACQDPDVANLAVVADFGNNRTQRFLAAAYSSQTAAVGVYAVAYSPLTDALVYNVGNTVEIGFVGTIGSTGSGNGQFNTIRGIAVDSAGNIYVADHNNTRVQKFTSAGVYVTKWSTSSKPHAIHVDADDRVMVGVEGGGVYIYQTDGTGIDGFGQGTIAFPGGITTDPDGYVYVTDLTNGNVTKWQYSPASGGGSVAIEVDGNLSPYFGIGLKSGWVGNAHHRSIDGGDTVVRAFGKSTDGASYTITGALLTAVAIPRK